ncbi:hypothetical protein BU24DRAFT_136627 [Aaosphaeria arxii CBS 175.79]|uniref:Uncharacterized protein n=1 Tax=Aaosphaeria arxii CBS 175.79 TaxID=1450172 RepID=A0A6A5Y679_9PLEO|nr:uncharacterized protein BU24DRAFT_136627 [Aaosphaeria arxii CBS 175.79]KAF2020300.1 hypothetical protein BU24DRAFT_136627 [Aaosphaeria arxii CBS 175.79]
MRKEEVEEEKGAKIMAIQENIVQGKWDGHNRKRDQRRIRRKRERSDGPEHDCGSELIKVVFLVLLLVLVLVLAADVMGNVMRNHRVCECLPLYGLWMCVREWVWMRMWVWIATAQNDRAGE